MHVPVLLNETIALMELCDSDLVLDGTVGFGGHSSHILAANPILRLIGIDQDPAAIAHSATVLGERATLVQGNFSNTKKLLTPLGVQSVTKILIDLGISSYQLDSAGRGFSFMNDEPLDMQMNPNGGRSAAQWLNTAPEKVLSDAFYNWGDLIHNRNLVQGIIQSRRKSPLKTTGELVMLVKKSYFFGSRPKMMKTMSQVFQAIRIAVNDELGVIQRFLNDELSIMSMGGRIAIISFHSGEDRLIKQFFKAHTDQFRPINKKVVTAEQDEIRQNSRSKPAKLRVYERIG